MKQYRMLFVFVAVMLAVTLACGSSTPAPVPTNTRGPVAPNPPSNSGGSAPAASGSSALVTFTDQNKFLAFDLPGNWTHENVPGDKYYVDVFTAPDKSAKIESFVYNDGKSFTGTDNGNFALYLLNKYYSNTGKEGDIRVSKDQIEKDGSESLQWTSTGGAYSGVSYFELRGPSNLNFLMFTLWWDNTAAQSIIDTLNNAVTSYRIP